MKSALLFVLLFISCHSWGAIEFVNVVSVKGGTTTAVTAETGHTAGNLLYVSMCYNSGSAGNGAHTFTTTNTAGDWFTPISSKEHSGKFAYCRQWYAKNIAGNLHDIVTVTADSALNDFMLVTVQQWSGCDPTNPLDATIPGGEASSGTSITSGSFSTATANEVLIAAAFDYYHTLAWTAGTGYTIPAGATVDSGATPGGTETSEYKIVSATQSSVTASITTASGVYGVLLGATFTQAGASATIPRHRVIQ